MGAVAKSGTRISQRWLRFNPMNGAAKKNARNPRAARMKNS